MTLDVRVAQASTAVVALTAATASASTLYKVAVGAGFEWWACWTLPVCVDGLDLVAAMSIQQRRRNWLAWCTVVAITAASVVLQVMASPPVLIYQLAHATPPLAFVVAFKLLLGATAAGQSRRPPVRKGATDRKETRPPAPAEVVATPTPASATRPAPASPPLVEPVRRRRSLTDAELEQVIAEIKGAYDATGRDLTSTAWRQELKDRGVPIGSTRAFTIWQDRIQHVNGKELANA